VEEEFLVVDAETRALRRQGLALLADARRELSESEVAAELHHSQVETATPVCASLGEVRSELERLRKELQSAATDRGLRIAALGTHPFSIWTEDPGVTADYSHLERDYRRLADEQIICGCHVHVGVDDAELAIEAMNRSRPWLSVVLALAGNSPFWERRDTGYASYRTELWRRWPLAGTPEAFSSRAEFDRVLEALLTTESIDDPARLYWDVRPSARFPTLEFRITDVCLTVDEAVLVAGLVRGLVAAALAATDAGQPAPRVRPELLRAATWRAARYGPDRTLVDVIGQQAAPARQLIDRLLDFAGPGLRSHGDEEEVRGLVQRVLEGGTGAARQRRALARQGRWEDVVDYAVARIG
jgi:carboxylate-amine ligase